MTKTHNTHSYSIFFCKSAYEIGKKSFISHDKKSFTSLNTATDKKEIEKSIEQRESLWELVKEED